METPQAKFKKELSRAFTGMLASASTASRQGDLQISKKIGFSTQQTKLLETLTTDQLDAVAEKYMRYADIEEFIKVDHRLLSNVLNRVLNDAEEARLIDEMLIRGACCKMMRDFFKMRNTQVSNRRILLGITPLKGRITHLSMEDEERIYHSWLANAGVEDSRLRMIEVNKETGISLAHIYRSVEAFEKNKMAFQSEHCA